MLKETIASGFNFKIESQQLFLPFYISCDSKNWFNGYSLNFIYLIIHLFYAEYLKLIEKIAGKIIIQIKVFPTQFINRLCYIIIN